MTMDFKGASSRVRRLLAPPRPQDLSKSALTEDLLRDNIIEEQGARSERFQRALDQRPELDFAREDGSTETREWDTYREAVRDYARAAFGHDEPQLRPTDQVRPGYRFNRGVIQGAIGSEFFRESRPYSRNNTAESLVGAVAFADKLHELGQGLASHAEAADSLTEAEQAQASAQDMMEQLRQRARQEVQDQGAVQDQTRRDIKQTMKAEANAAAQAADLAAAQEAAGGFGAGMVAGREAAQAAKDAVNGFGMLPGVGGGAAHNLSVDQRIELAEQWTRNEKLMKVARMLGRMMPSMVQARDARVANVKQIPVGITTGSDIDRMLPQELARALSPNLLIRAMWMQDYLSNSLLIREYEGERPTNKGPIIPVHDGSGSMAGEKFTWATALCLALLTIANRERRWFAGAEFGSEGQVKSWVFPGNEAPDPYMVLDYATHFFNGGTSTATGLEEALRVMREQPEFEAADVVIIGDGIDYVTDRDLAVKRALEDLGCRLHGISILTPNNSYMQAMCEYVVDVMDLAGPNDASTQLVQSIT